MVVKIGFIGCGRIAERHASNLTRIKDARIVAISDIDKVGAKKFSERTKANFYDNPEEMIRKEKVDAIYVCTPPFIRGIEILAAEQRISIFVEKPVALNLDLAKSIENAINSSGVISSVGYMLRYFDTTEKVKKFIERDGPLGLLEGYEHFPLSIDEKRRTYPYIPPGHWMLSKERAGEQIVESVTHIIDLSRYLAGEVDKVYAELNYHTLTSLSELDRADVSVLTLRFKSGALGTIACALGGIKSSGLRIVLPNTVIEHGAHNGIIKIFKEGTIEQIDPVLDPYFEEDRVFVEAVASGSVERIKSTYRDGVMSLAISLAAVKSSQEHKAADIT